MENSELIIALLTACVVLLSLVIVTLLAVVITLMVKVKRIARNVDEISANLAAATEWVTPAKIVSLVARKFRK